VLEDIVGTTKFVALFTMDIPEWLQLITTFLVRDGSVNVMSVRFGLLAYPFIILATEFYS